MLQARRPGESALPEPPYVMQHGHGGTGQRHIGPDPKDATKLELSSASLDSLLGHVRDDIDLSQVLGQPGAEEPK